MRLWTPVAVGEDEGAEVTLQADAPKDRVVLGDYHVLTYEFDVADPEFLKLQLSWLRVSDKRTGSHMDRLFRHCSAFADFRGITVNYSGNKSLHIHVVFSTDLARSRLGLDGCRSPELRHGFATHWERLHQQILNILDVQGYRADEHLRFAESFRRIPNGSRVIEGKHLLGVAERVILPQVTLWEKVRERASGGELPLFWCPEAFQATLKATRVVRSTYAKAAMVGGGLTEDQRVYCETQLRSWYPDWPRLDRLSFESNRWAAKFSNSEHDRTSSSIMREDYASIHLAGRDAAGLDARRLPFPLGAMLRLWCGQLARQQDHGEADEETVSLDDVLFATAANPALHPL